jgi:hypothetical protein
MTRKTGSERHPAGKITQIPIPDMPPPVPASETRRMLDPIRDAALKSAVAIACVEIAGGRISTPETVRDLATKLERYLTGEEADDPTHPR